MRGSDTDVGTRPVLDPTDVTPTHAYRVDGILLAAGTSSRYGTANKLLEPVAGKPVVEHAARSLIDAPLSSVSVVTGHDANRVRSALADLPVDIVHNEAYDRGQAASLEAGITALPSETRGVVIALGDMPAGAPSSIRALVRAYRAGRASALAAAHEGVRGNPVLFDRRYFDRLVTIDGDRGGRAILRSGDDTALVETGDPGVTADIDEPGDRQRVEALVKQVNRN